MTGAAPLQALGLSRMPSTRLPVLRPTPFCNPDCDCCDLPHRDARQRMSITRLRRAAKRLVDDGPAGKELTAIWHAGEPMAVPIEFYPEVPRTSLRRGGGKSLSRLANSALSGLFCAQVCSH